MRFVDRKGQEVITVRELFRSKKFLRGINEYYLFIDHVTQEKEIWTFVECLSELIPFNIGIDNLKEILLHCGWCRKIEESDIKTSNEKARLSIKELMSEI